MTELPTSRRFKVGNEKRHEVFFTEDGRKYRLVATVAHNDDCGNWHNTFSVTGVLYRLTGITTGRTRWVEEVGACMHDEIAKRIPHLAPYLKWHLCSTDGPLHYLANTLFHAGDTDCWGKRKGEARQWEIKIKVGNDPVLHSLGSRFVEWLRAEYSAGARIFSTVEVPHKDKSGEGYRFAPKYTFKGYLDDRCEWYQCPFETLDEAKQWESAINFGMLEFQKIPTAWGEGSEPNLEAARKCAIWPEATLEQLQSRGALEDRLPRLMEEFKKAVEELGLVY